MGMGNAQHVTEKEFSQQVLQSEVPVLVDFWAEWCAPCRMIAPIVEEFATEYGGRMKVVKVDVDNNGGIAHKYSIMSIPTLGVFKQGELVERIVGYMPKQELKRRIDAAITQRATAG
jgi:thioredoxin 1